MKYRFLVSGIFLALVPMGAKATPPQLAVGDLVKGVVEEQGDRESLLRKMAEGLKDNHDLKQNDLNLLLAPNRGLGSAKNKIMLRNVAERFRSEEGIAASVRTLPWREIGIGIPSLAQDEVEALKAARKNADVAREQGKRTQTLVALFSSARDCGPTSDDLVHRLIHEPGAAALLHQIYGKSFSIRYEQIGRCVAKKMEQDLKKDIQDDLEKTQGCLTPQGIRETLEAQKIHVEAIFYERFERTMMAKGYGIPALAAPTPSAFPEQLTSPHQADFHEFIEKPLKKAFNAFLAEEIADYRKRCARAFKEGI